MLPRSFKVKRYGRVWFFTRTHGKARTGVLVRMLALEGPLRDHVIRYMHLAAVHPSLKRGSIVDAGAEVGLMGATAVQESVPHVHIDLTTPDGRRLDVAPFLGLPPTDAPCP